MNTGSLYAWQRPTLPGVFTPSTIGAGGLNDGVRNGNRCGPSAIITRPSGLLVSGFLPETPCPLKTSSKPEARPRPIRICPLHPSRDFHARPIDLIFSEGSYHLSGVGNLISRGASRLDAFSAYPVPTWLPSGAPGGTTGPPAVGPSRSSRTRDSSSQISRARDR